ncbi:MAG: hypothetical protein D6761_10095, partial [Candidatus Dadabacteria bacterium]
MQLNRNARGIGLSAQPPSAWRLRLAVLATVALVTIGGLWNRFAWEDYDLILESGFFDRIENVQYILTRNAYYLKEKNRDPRAAGGKHFDLYRPLTHLSYLVDRQLWGDRPFGYHLTNQLFHLL